MLNTKLLAILPFLILSACASAPTLDEKLTVCGADVECRTVLIDAYRAESEKQAAEVRAALMMLGIGGHMMRPSVDLYVY